MKIANARPQIPFSRRMIGPVVLVVILLFAALVVLGSMLPPKDGHKPITIILRYDDYSAVSNTHLESQILETLERHQLPCIFAVIPCVTTNGFRNPQPADSLTMDAEKIALLKPYIDRGLIELCVHGCTHQTQEGKSLHTLSEFSGRPYEIQLQRLTHAKGILESQFGHTVKTFVPPWGNYDDNTLRAAEAAGFSIISADPRGPASDEQNLLYVPGTCRIHQLMDAITEARSLPSSGSTLITAVIHPYDFIESDKERGVITFQQFEEMLAEISNDPGLRFTTAAGATQLFSDLSAARLIKAGSLRNSSVNLLVPELLQLGYPTKTYVDAKLAKTLLERERVWCIAIYVMGLFGIVVGVNRARRILPQSWSIHRKKALIVGYTLLALLLLYSLFDMQVYAAGLSALVGLLGVLIGATID